MYAIDLFAAETTMAKHTWTAQHAARQRDLLRQTKGQRQSWVSRQRCRFAHHLGLHLVMLGEWLEASGRPQPSF